MYEIYIKYKSPVEFFLSIVVFWYLVAIGEMLHTIHFEDIVYAILSYIVILELLKMLGQYVFDRRFSVLVVLDTFFIFTLRETILLYTNKDTTGAIEVIKLNDFVISINEKMFYIFISIVIMTVILYFRGKCKKNKLAEENKRRDCGCDIDL